jgi:hypothetical protein
MAEAMDSSEEMSPVTVKMLVFLLSSEEEDGEGGAGRRSWAVTLHPAAGWVDVSIFVLIDCL